MADSEVLDEGRKLAEGQPERPGASVRLQYVITTGPTATSAYYWVLEDGKLLESVLGELPDAEVTLTESYEDAMRIQKNELDATRVHAGKGEGHRQHGKAHGDAADHEFGGVQAAPGRDTGDHRVLINCTVPGASRPGRPCQPLRMSSRRAR